MALYNIQGYDFLGSTVLAAGAANTATVDFAARDILLIQYRITGYGGGGDIGSFQFGGTAGTVDTGNNYWSRHISAAAGGVVWADTPTASTNMIRLGQAATGQQRSGILTINNLTGVSKICNILNQTSTGAAATVGVMVVSGGEWVNTTQQLICARLITAAAANMNTGSGFAVFGKNL